MSLEEPIEVDTDPSPGIDAALHAALDNETRVPNPILDLLPSPEITVSSLLEKSLPALLSPSAINLRPVKSSTTNAAARWTVKELLEAAIPPRRWLSDLEITLRKEWLTSARVTSIRHPTNSNLHFPLWVGNFWYSLVDAVEQKEKWKRAEGWVSRLVQDPKVYEARGLMQQIPWGMRIWALTGAESSSFVGVLARLLSTDWLRERHLDTLGSYLNFRASEDGEGRTGYWVGDVYFSTCLKRVYRATRATIRADWDLKKYRDGITACGSKRLLFPANLDNNHWVTFGVDFEKQEFCYGAPSCFAALRHAYSLPLYPI